jgi:hypothetical protein
MSTQRAGWRTLWMNLLLTGLGVAVLVLLYAFVSRTLLPPPDPTRDDNPAALTGDIIQVEVRNGCGVAGLAEELRTFLIDAGFDVVWVGNHTSFNEPKTLVVDRVGNPAAAREVAEALGLPPERVVEDIGTDYYLDASVIIGQDYASWPPFQKEDD